MKIMIEMMSRVPSVIPMIASVERFDLVSDSGGPLLQVTFIVLRAKSTQLPLCSFAINPSCVLHRESVKTRQVYAVLSSLHVIISQTVQP